MEKFGELLKLHEKVETAMSAVCALKGGIDIDNYSGRYFAADLLEMTVLFGEKLGVKDGQFEELRTALAKKKDLVTPSVKPIYEMTLAEFERMIGQEN